MDIRTTRRVCHHRTSENGTPTIAARLASAGSARRAIVGWPRTNAIDVIHAEWPGICDLARLTALDRVYFWRLQFLNPYALEGYRPPASSP
jgi:hypothetical protein